jgi:hypothetical protein
MPTNPLERSRHITIEGDTWYVAADVCRESGLGRYVHDHIASLNKDEKRKARIEGVCNHMVVVSLSGAVKIMERADRTKPISDESRFWSRVDKSAGENNCWIWTAGDNGIGYGQLSINGKPMLAHRFSFKLANGSIPDGQFVCHHCDNPSCVNPSHLFAGTAVENTSDARGKGRLATGPRNGTKTRPERTARGDLNGSRRHPERLTYGEDNPATKLTSASVVEILAFKGMESQRRVARMFGICQQNVSKIWRGLTWVSLQDGEKAANDA